MDGIAKEKAVNKRPVILAGMGAAMLWSVALVALAQGLKLPFMPINVALLGAMVPPGLVTLVLVGRLAGRRFFDDGLIDGQDYPAQSPGWIDQKVLANTLEQIVLALCLWPFVALTLGGQVALALGFGFAIGRIAFWVGYHLSPPLRAFGFGATFYPTVLATLWALWKWAT